MPGAILCWRQLRRAGRALVLGALASMLAAVRSPVAAQADSLVRVRNDSVSVEFIDVELHAAVQALGRYLDRPIVVGGVNNARVTLETPHPVPRAEIPRLLRGLLESQHMALVSDTAAGVYRLESREPQRPIPPPVQNQQAATSSAIELFVIRLRHAKAADVAADVNALYGRASALGESELQSQTLAGSLRAQQVPPGLPPNAGLPPATPTGIAAGRSATLTGEVTIVPDARANSLLVRASPSDFPLIKAAVDALDVRPLQVVIEVLIAELRRDRSFEFGVGASLPPTVISGTGGTTVEATTTGSGVSDFVLKVMGIGGTKGLNIEAELRAAASRGDAKIISRPVLLAANNEAAEINVGSQRPFVQVARVLATDNAARDQVVQYKDVGTRLHIVPTISSDGYVMLSVTQEVNEATAEQEFDAPVISTRSVESRLLVRDGQTIVLGGLTDRQKEANQRGVPILSSIPILGGLFGSASRQTVETELYLFLTPHVIYADQDVDSLTAPLRRRVQKIER